MHTIIVIIEMHGIYMLALESTHECIKSRFMLDSYDSLLINQKVLTQFGMFSSSMWFFVFAANL